jgi:hypothetical protein
LPHRHALQVVDRATGRGCPRLPAFVGEGHPVQSGPYADLVAGTIIDDEQLDLTEWFEDFFE